VLSESGRKKVAGSILGVPTSDVVKTERGYQSKKALKEESSKNARNYVESHRNPLSGATATSSTTGYPETSVEGGDVRLYNEAWQNEMNLLSPHVAWVGNQKQINDRLGMESDLQFKVNEIRTRPTHYGPGGHEFHDLTWGDMVPAWWGIGHDTEMIGKKLKNDIGAEFRKQSKTLPVPSHWQSQYAGWATAAVGGLAELPFLGIGATLEAPAVAAYQHEHGTAPSVSEVAGDFSRGGYRTLKGIATNPIALALVGAPVAYSAIGEFGTGLTEGVKGEAAPIASARANAAIRAYNLKSAPNEFGIGYAEGVSGEAAPVASAVKGGVDSLTSAHFNTYLRYYNAKTGFEVPDLSDALDRASESVKVGARNANVEANVALYNALEAAKSLKNDINFYRDYGIRLNGRPTSGATFFEEPVDVEGIDSQTSSSGSGSGAEPVRTSGGLLRFRQAPRTTAEEAVGLGTDSLARAIELPKTIPSPRTTAEEAVGLGTDSLARAIELPKTIPFFGQTHLAGIGPSLDTVQSPYSWQKEWLSPTETGFSIEVPKIKVEPRVEETQTYRTPQTYIEETTQVNSPVTTQITETPVPPIEVAVPEEPNPPREPTPLGRRHGFDDFELGMWKPSSSKPRKGKGREDLLNPNWLSEQVGQFAGIDVGTAFNRTTQSELRSQKSRYGEFSLLPSFTKAEKAAYKEAEDFLLWG